MKTEPNVAHFTIMAKERICHALTHVRPPRPAAILRLFERVWKVAGWLSQGQQQPARAIKVYGQVLQLDPHNVNVLKDRAEAYIQNEQYEEGKHCHMISYHM